MPLYAVVTVVVIFLTLVDVNYAEYNLKQIYKWLEGWILFNGKFLGDFPSTLIIAGVNWTLIYEWGFYFSLPILHAIFHKKIIDKRYFAIAFVIFLIIFLETKEVFICCFCCQFFLFYLKI